MQSKQTLPHLERKYGYYGLLPDKFAVFVEYVRQDIKACKYYTSNIFDAHRLKKKLADMYTCEYNIIKGVTIQEIR